METVDEADLTRVADAFAARLAQSGLPRTTGRLLGWLLVCDPPSQSTTDLVEGLRISKASITTGMQFLVGTGLVERVHLRGSRQAHYRADTKRWADLMASKLDAIRAMRTLADEGLAAMGADSARGTRLRDVRDLYGYFEQGYADLVRGWTEMKEERR